MSFVDIKSIMGSVREYMTYCKDISKHGLLSSKNKKKSIRDKAVELQCDVLYLNYFLRVPKQILNKGLEFFIIHLFFILVIDGETASLGGGATRDGQSENDTEEASCSINYHLCSTKNMFFEIIIWSPQSVVYMCTLKQFHQIVFNGR